MASKQDTVRHLVAKQPSNPKLQQHNNSSRQACLLYSPPSEKIVEKYSLQCQRRHLHYSPHHFLLQPHSLSTLLHRPTRPLQRRPNHRSTRPSLHRRRQQRRRTRVYSKSLGQCSDVLSLKLGTEREGGSYTLKQDTCTIEELDYLLAQYLLRILTQHLVSYSRTVQKSSAQAYCRGLFSVRANKNKKKQEKTTKDFVEYL
jgi:hypothetical protein